jgi:hypothetical protein
MPQAQLFRLGAEVHCTDGDCGKLRSLVIRPRDDAVTHLVVEHSHHKDVAMIVPLGLVDAGADDTATGEVRLRCTRAEFERLDPAETTLLPGDEGYEDISYRWEPEASWPYYATQGPLMPGAPGTPGVPGAITRPVIVDTVPDQLPGEDEVSRGEHVHATDGDIGHVLGFVVEASSGRVTSILLREGHLLSRRTVLIPRSAVAQVGWDGFHLNIAREQVQHLPHADVEHPPPGLQAGLPGERGLSHLAGRHDELWAVAKHGVTAPRGRSLWARCARTA